MKVFRLDTELFLDYDLEYININNIDDINNYEINAIYYIIIIRNKFIVRYNFNKEHTVLNIEQINKIVYNFLNYAEYDDTSFFKEFDYHNCCIKNHDKCYM